jgi:hypothetical protein
MKPRACGRLPNFTFNVALSNYRYKKDLITIFTTRILYKGYGNDASSGPSFSTIIPFSPYGSDGSRSIFFR